jgi:hypothetical protein
MCPPRRIGKQQCGRASALLDDAAVLLFSLCPDKLNGDSFLSAA